MSDFTFELAFDWQAKPRANGIGRIYPLQASLVTNGPSGQVISPASVSQIKPQDTLDFRIYDISRTPALGVAPTSLQVLFNRATEETPPQTFFTPLMSGTQEVPELTSTAISTTSVATIAYAPGTPGWDVGGPEQTLSNQGRFELRMMATVAVLGQLAKFYFVDPEMIICPDATC